MENKTKKLSSENLAIQKMIEERAQLNAHIREMKCKISQIDLKLIKEDPRFGMPSVVSW